MLAFKVITKRDIDRPGHSNKIFFELYKTESCVKWSTFAMDRCQSRRTARVNSWSFSQNLTEKLPGLYV